MKNNILKKLRGNIVSFFTNLKLKFAPVRYIHCVVQESVADAMVDHEHEFNHSNDYLEESDVADMLDDVESRISRNLDISEHMSDILYNVECEGYLNKTEVEEVIEDNLSSYVHEDDFVDLLKNYGKVDELVKQAVEDLVDERVKAQLTSMIQNNHYIFKIESIKYLSNS